MKINSLSLLNFRNYESLTCQFNPQLNIIVGDNAQGKTNLLESIYFMSTLRSFRTQSDQDLIRFDQDYFKVQCEIETELTTKNCQVLVFKSGKSIKINETIIKKSSDYIGTINCVSFSPQDLNFFNDSPKTRRKFLDIEATKLSRQYLYHLNNYVNLLKQRNALLKQPNVDEEILMILSKQLVDDMWEIVSYRQEIVDFLNSKTQVLFNELSESDDLINFELKTEVEVTSESEFKQKMMDKMIQNKARDIYFKVTHAGCHRDDLITMMNNHDINTMASQGQKRLVLIALKLALIEFITQKQNETPILLLDDVFSELDETHQQLFIKNTPSNIQTIITTTSIDESIKLNRPMTIYEIEAGQLVERRDLNG